MVLAIIATIATVGVLSALSVPVQTASAQCETKSEPPEFKQECVVFNIFTCETKIEVGEFKQECKLID